MAGSLEACRHKTASAGQFLARRFLRIFSRPTTHRLSGSSLSSRLSTRFRLSRLHRGPYALEISSPGQLTAAQWWGNLSLTETWRPLLFKGPCDVFTSVGWSLCYQEQFYLISVLPLVLSRAATVPRGIWPRRRALGIVASANFGLGLGLTVQD